MLAAKQDTESLFFISFVERAIKGEEAYIKIITPIILDAADFANDKIKITGLNREALPQKLKLQSFKLIKEVTPENLQLEEMLKFLNNSL